MDYQGTLTISNIIDLILGLPGEKVMKGKKITVIET